MMRRKNVGTEDEGKKGLVRKFLKSQSGELGIQQIAATVAVIVVIGFIILAVKDNMDGWIGQLWTMFKEKLDTMIQ